MGEPVLITDANGLPVIFNCFLAQKPRKNRLTFGTRKAKRDRKPSLKHAGNTVIACATDLVNRDHATIRVIASNWNWIYCDLIIHMGCFILMRAIWDVYPWIVVGRFFDINKYLFLFFSLFSFFFFFIVITLVASYGHCERTVVVRK